MEFEIRGENEFYCYLILTIYNTTSFYGDDEIARILKITKDQYISILRTVDGFYIDDGDTFFTTKEYAKEAIEKLEPYIIAAKLIRGV